MPICLQVHVKFHLIACKCRVRYSSAGPTIHIRAPLIRRLFMNNPPWVSLHQRVCCAVCWCVCVRVCFLFMLVVNGGTSCEYYSLWTLLLRTLRCATVNREILLIDKVLKTKLKSLNICAYLYTRVFCAAYFENGKVILVFSILIVFLC